MKPTKKNPPILHKREIPRKKIQETNKKMAIKPNKEECKTSYLTLNIKIP
jgi:hypothetical protein